MNGGKVVVRANTLAAESGATGVYNVAGGKRVTVKDLARAIAKAAGVEAKVEYQQPRAGDLRDSLADISRAKSWLENLYRMVDCQINS